MKVIRELPLYFAALAIVLSGIHAATSTVGAPGFTVLVNLLVVIGFVVSIVLRNLRELRNWMLYPIYAGLGVVLLQCAIQGFLRRASILMPAEALSDVDLMLGIGLVWIVVFRSFTLISDDHLLFCIVPNMALFGLMGVHNLNPGIISGFLVFVFASIFLLSYQSRLRAVGEFARLGLFGQIRLVSLIFVIVTILGLMLTPVLKLISPQLLPRAFPYWARSVFYYPPWGVPYSAFWDFFEMGRGPTRLSDAVVMTVKSDKPALWRGCVYDYYNGHGWEKGDTWQTAFSRDGRFYISPSSGAKDIKIIEQSFTHETSTITAIFGAAEPRMLVFPGWHIHVDASNCLRAQSIILEGTTYEVHSEVVEVSGLAVKDGLPIPEDIGERYLQVPPSCSEVVELANKVTGDCNNSYDKVLAIINYLQRNCDYNLNTPPVPRGVDVVRYFLLESREGYCDLFASAMAIMCRAVGIPARVAAGYATGDYDRVQGRYVVRGLDAHAWVEAYFPGHGWVTFDPTPSRVRGSFMWVSAVKGIFNPLIKIFRAKSTLLVGIIVLFGVLFYPILRGALCRIMVHKPEAKMKPLGRRGLVIYCYNNMCEELAALGYPRKGFQTPREYVVELAAYPLYKVEELLGNIEVITNVFVEARYSQYEVTEEKVALVRRALGEMMNKVRRRNVKAA